jgi:hypothetical protein
MNTFKTNPKLIVFVIAITIFLLITLVSAPSFEINTPVASQTPISLKSGVVVIQRNGTLRGNTFLIFDLQTGQQTPFYSTPSGWTITSSDVDQAYQNMYAIMAEGDFLALENTKVVRINLQTSEESILWSHPLLWSVNLLPSQNKLLISYWDSVEERQVRSGGTRTFCVLDLQTLNCEVIENGSTLYLNHYSLQYWLDDENFLAGDDVGMSLIHANIITGAIEESLEEWRVFGFVPLDNPNEFLVTLLPNEGESYPSPTTAHFHIYNLEERTLSDALGETASFSTFRRMNLSPNEQYLLYTWNYGPFNISIVNLSTGETTFTTRDVFGLTWLPDGENLIGLHYSDDNYDAVVRVNAASGDVETLFPWSGGGVSFIVIN